jgi:hypothetical protein
MTSFVYLSCAATSVACALLLFRGWRQSRQRLLLWSAVCFAGLALNNVLMVVDFLVVPQTDLSLARNLVALASIAVLLFGLVWETR